MQDITAPKYPVEVDIRNDGEVLWVNVDGKCVLRICQMSGLILCDKRNKAALAENKMVIKLSKNKMPMISMT